MKKLLVMGVAALAVGAVADEATVKGRVRYVVMHPDVIVTVDTGKGFKQVFLGTEDDFEGVKLWLDRSDTISVHGQMEDGRLVAERMWVNGGYFKIPNPPMRDDMDTEQTRTLVSYRWMPMTYNAHQPLGWVDATRQ